MITIRTYNGGKFFDIPNDITISMEYSSPFFGENGTYSLPLTLPSTPNNLSLVSYCHRADAGENPAPINVIVQNGIYAFSGEMNILSFSDSDGIEVTILAENSYLNSILGDLTLVDICHDWILHTASSRVDLIEWIESQTEPGNESGSALNFLSCFPVATSTCVLNRQSVVSGSSGLYPLYEFTEKNTGVSYDAGDYTINYSAGYWITPFLRIWRLVQRIVEYCGFSIDDSDNVFRTTVELSQLCLLNNSIDPCMTSDFKLYARHLVPNIKAVDFLDEMFHLFGVRLYVDGIKVKTYIMDEVMRKTCSADVDVFVSGSKSISFGTRQCLEITSSNDPLLSDETVSMAESIQTLQQGKDGQSRTIWCKEKNTFDNTRALHTPEYNPDYYDLFQNEKMERFIGFLNWIPDDLTDNHLSIQLINVPYQMVQARISDQSINESVPYIGEGLNVVTDVSVTKSDGTVVDCTLNSDCPFCLCYDNRGFNYSGYYRNLRYGSRIAWKNLYTEDRWTYGTSDTYPIYPDSISPDYAYWSLSLYDQALRGGMNEITVELNISALDFMKLSFFSPVAIQGRKCLLKSYKFKLSDNNVEILEAVLLTLTER